ncbi:MAG: glycine zipper family protein [Longimicrobiales bacterium]|nr:glycine zipper family protein [Longimicrobiales bacterium]
MKTTLKESIRYSRFLAFAAFLSVGAAACADAESSEAPEEGDMPAQEAEVSDDMTEDAPVADRSAGDPAPSAKPAMRTLAPTGTTMSFFIDQEVSTNTHAVGDRFVATLDTPVRDASGNVVLPAGTPSQWVVTQSSVQDGEALLAVQIESVEWNDRWVPATATVTKADLDADNPDSGSETAAKIGVGAAAGALVGQILGKNTESTLKGAGVGAAVGTAVALATKGGSAKLPAGSILTVRLDKALTVS